MLSRRRNGNDEWKLAFRRALFQWEIEDLRRLEIMLLNAPAIRDGMVDRLKWNAENSGVFTVSSAYKWSAASVEASSVSLLYSVCSLGCLCCPKVSASGLSNSFAGHLAAGCNLVWVLCNLLWATVGKCCEGRLYSSLSRAQSI
ncbi:hypothetical protein LOK49_LG03G02841 [Camellia lanceoleosa]|uniref:Uncharacterized protein n=1 Tax=Camellia lanceoleosa TaxID=1840588 RepID=A0ACC0IC38_9ERIC|nr:hypothetical protein LOK49_LG03G02841 [Camellia lanceoleosa]